MRGWRWALASREPQLRVGSADACLRQAELAADDVGALHERHAFVEGDAARQTLATETAIGRDDKSLLRNVFKGLTDQVGDFLGRLDDRVGMADDTDADLFVARVFRE